MDEKLVSISNRLAGLSRSVAFLAMFTLGAGLPNLARAGFFDDIGSALKEGAKSVVGVVDGAISKATQQGDAKMSPQEFVRRHEANDAWRKGNAKIHDAVVANDLAAFDAELRNRNTLNAPNENGMTPLYLASVLARVQMVEKLIALKANINQRDTLGYTPLFQSWVVLQYAAVTAANEYAERLKVIQGKLVARGASYETANNAGVTPPLFWLLDTNRQYSPSRNNIDDIPDMSPGNESVWQSMLSRMNVNRTYEFRGEPFADGSTLLHVAAKGCRANLVRMLLENNADPTVRNQAIRPCRRLGLEYNHDSSPTSCVGSPLVGRTAVEEVIGEHAEYSMREGRFSLSGASPRCKATYEALTGR